MDTPNASPYGHRCLQFTPAQSKGAAVCHVGLKGRLMGHEGPSLGSQGQQMDGYRRDVGSWPLSAQWVFGMGRGGGGSSCLAPPLPQSKCIIVVPIFPRKEVETQKS